MICGKIRGNIHLLVICFCDCNAIDIFAAPHQLLYLCRVNIALDYE